MDTSETRTASGLVLRAGSYLSNSYSHYQFVILVAPPDSENEMLRRYQCSGGGDATLCEKGDRVTVTFHRPAPDHHWNIQSIQIDFDITTEKARVSTLTTG